MNGILLVLLSSIGLASAQVLIGPNAVIIPKPVESAPVEPSSLVTNLIAHWTMDEASGNLMDCISGHTMLTSSVPMLKTPIVINNGASNNNTATRYFYIPDNATFSAGSGKSFTIAAWFQPNQATARSWIASKFNSTGNNVEWYMDWDNHKFGFTASTNGVDNFDYPQTSASFLASPGNDVTNYLATFAFDSATRLWRVSAHALHTNEFITNTLAGPIFDGNANFEIMAVSSASVWNGGGVDIVSYWNRMLTTNEVLAYYNSGVGTQLCSLGSPAVTYIINQNFEGSGYDNSETGWTESGTPDENYTGVVLRGAESLRINAASQYTEIQWSGPLSTAWAFCRFRLISLPAANDTAIFKLGTASSYVTDVYVDTDGSVQLYADGSAGSSSATTLTTGVDYFCWLKHVNTGQCELAISTNINTKPTSDGGGSVFLTKTGSADDMEKVQIATDNISGNETIFDQVLVDDAVIGTNPP